jgi:hypothetical protein
MRVTLEIRGKLRKPNPSTSQREQTAAEKPQRVLGINPTRVKVRSAGRHDRSLIFLIRGEYRRSRMVDAEK